MLFLTSVVRVRVSQSRWSIASSSFYTNVAVIFDSIDIFCVAFRPFVDRQASSYSGGGVALFFMSSG